MSPIYSVLSTYKESSIDFNYEIQFHLMNGIVFSDDKTFMFAIPCDSENPEIPVPIDSANCIFISMLASRTVVTFRMPDRCVQPPLDVSGPIHSPCP